MKGRTQRIYTLDRWLRQGRRIVAKDVAAEFGVNEKTIRRTADRLAMLLSRGQAVDTIQTLCVSKTRRL